VVQKALVLVSQAARKPGLLPAALEVLAATRSRLPTPHPRFFSLFLGHEGPTAMDRRP
jgi:hypothetical protein